MFSFVELPKCRLASLMPAAVLALLNDEPKPSFVHGRALLFVRIVVDRFGTTVRTFFRSSYRGMIAARRCLLLPVVTTMACLPTCGQDRRNRRAASLCEMQGRSRARPRCCTSP